MADFQNGLICRIFGVFSNGFLHKTTLMVLAMSSAFLIFDPN